MAEERQLFVARPDDVEALNTHWEAVRGGDARLLRLQAPFGGGRRALVNEFVRRVAGSTDDPLIWRFAGSDQENGVQWLIRLYGSLVATVSSDVLRRGKVEMILNGQLPSQTKRVQGWFENFVSTIKEAKADPETGQMQLRIPQDNPLIGLVEIVAGISRKTPILLDLQGAFGAHSVLVGQFLECLFDEVKSHKGRLFTIVHDEPPSDTTASSHPLPLLNFYERRAEVLHTFQIAPWGAEETSKLLESRELSSDPARLAEIAGGRPGYILELIDILEERGELAGDLSSATMASLVPMTVDEDDLEVPEAPPAEGERKHATADDASRVAFLAALLGHVFPSALLAEMGGFARESVDDLVDAMGGLFEEVQFSEQMGTWIYRFKRGSFREGILESNATDEGHQLARNVGVFMERFLVPRGYGFMVRTARIYAEHGAHKRASAMRAIALSNDAPDVWGMAYETIKYFDEVPWPDQLRRSVYTTLLDHLAGGGNLQAAERVHTEVTEWATEKEDRELQAWLLFNGSKLDARRQDFYRARDRARDALKLFEALENKPRMAEIQGHIASIELADGNPTAAITAVDEALTLATRDGEDGKKIVLPGVLAQAEMVRGVVARRAGKIDEAIEHFRRANEVAGTTGLGPQALDAGLSLGEALMAKGEVEKARDVLRRLLTATRQIGALPRERAAAELLARAEGASRNLEGALELAQRVLQISQQLRMDHALPVDLYNVGFYHLTMNKGVEALPFFKQAEAQLKGNDTHPILKDLWYYSGLANLQAGHLEDARASLRKSIKPLQQARDVPKIVTAFDQLAAIEHRGGNTEAAKKLLTDALGLARDNNMKEQRKALKKRLDALS